MKLKINNSQVPTPCHMCFETECIMTLQGYRRSLILAPIESMYGTSYWSSIVTLVLSCPVSEILELLYVESHFFHTPPLLRSKFRIGLVPWCRSVVLESADSEHTRLTVKLPVPYCFWRIPTYVITIGIAQHQTITMTQWQWGLFHPCNQQQSNNK